MLRPRALGLALFAFLALACNHKHPVASDAQATAGGKEMFELCVQCHGAQGEGRREFNAPSIAGLPRWYIEAQLRKFRSGARGTHFADLTGMQMRPMAMSFHNEGDLTTIAEYVASLPRQTVAHQLAGGDPARGKTFYTPCTACHGPDGAGNEQLKAPPLRHASDWYLLAQLKKFREGVRGANPLDLEGAQMRPMAATLVDEQAMKDVVAHITTLK
jgi:cytochrome c oxidase subunit 2